jgi:toxin YoeB
MSKPIHRVAAVSTHFREDLRFWIETDRKVALRILDLMTAVLADPSAGIGKPESLRFELAAACWSRRSTQEHRLVYRVAGDPSTCRRAITISERVLYSPSATLPH